MKIIYLARFLALLIFYSQAAFADCSVFNVEYQDKGTRGYSSDSLNKEKVFLMKDPALSDFYRKFLSAKPSGKENNDSFARIGISKVDDTELIIILNDGAVLFKEKIYDGLKTEALKAIAAVEKEQIKHKRRHWDGTKIIMEEYASDNLPLKAP